MIQDEHVDDDCRWRLLEVNSIAGVHLMIVVSWRMGRPKILWQSICIGRRKIIQIGALNFYVDNHGIIICSLFPWYVLIPCGNHVLHMNMINPSTINSFEKVSSLQQCNFKRCFPLPSVLVFDFHCIYLLND